MTIGTNYRQPKAFRTFLAQLEKRVSERIYVAISRAERERRVQQLVDENVRLEAEIVRERARLERS